MVTPCLYEVDGDGALSTWGWQLSCRPSYRLQPWEAWRSWCSGTSPGRRHTYVCYALCKHSMSATFDSATQVKSGEHWNIYIYPYIVRVRTNWSVTSGSRWRYFLSSFLHSFLFGFATYSRYPLYSVLRRPNPLSPVRYQSCFFTVFMLRTPSCVWSVASDLLLFSFTY